MKRLVRARWRRNTCNGFSIVEVVWVLVITGLFAAIAAPRFSSSIGFQRVEAAARRIVIDMALAQRRAQSTNASQTVRFAPATHAYSLLGMADPDHAALTYGVSLQTEPYGATIVAADFGGDLDIVFDMYGMPDSGGTVVIQSGGRVRTIVVDADSGKASVQ